MTEKCVPFGQLYPHGDSRNMIRISQSQDLITQDDTNATRSQLLKINDQSQISQYSINTSQTPIIDAIGRKIDQTLGMLN